MTNAIAETKTAAKDHIPKKIINVVFRRNIYELEVDLSVAFTCSSAVISRCRKRKSSCATCGSS